MRFPFPEVKKTRFGKTYPSFLPEFPTGLKRYFHCFSVFSSGKGQLPWPGNEHGPVFPVGPVIWPGFWNWPI